MTVCLTAIFALSAWAHGATISDVTVRQRWPWDRKVDIDYVLSSEPGQLSDVLITARNGTQTLVLPDASFTGERFNVEQGEHRIVWDPMATGYTNALLTQFNVCLVPTNPPLYMVVDLTKTAGEDGEIEYVYAGDARLTTIEGWTNVWFGVTNDTQYMTDKLVLRRVSAGSYLMGASTATTYPVTLTKDFYIGVFEVTQAQYERIMGVAPSCYFTNATYAATRPVEQISYDKLRGSVGEGGGGWPTNDAIYAQSLIGKLRAQTGIGAFDLPTEAQWEYACRANVTNSFYNGNDITNDTRDASLNTITRYKYNDGYLNDGATPPNQNSSPANGTARVGSYQPNAWGLYDMLGNVWEWCLNYSGVITGGTDPLGPLATGTSHNTRGGSWLSSASRCTSAFNSSALPSVSTANYTGFRLVIRLH